MSWPMGLRGASAPSRDHSDICIRYDDNLAFVQHRVLPIIEELRKPVVAAHGTS